MLLRNVFTKTVRDLRWPTFWVSLGCGAMTGYFAILFPTHSKLFDLNSMLEEDGAGGETAGGEHGRCQHSHRLPSHRTVLDDPALRSGCIRSRNGQRFHGGRGIARHHRHTSVISRVAPPCRPGATRSVPSWTAWGRSSRSHSSANTWGDDPLRNGLNMGDAAVLAAVAALFLALAVVAFERRDLAARRCKFPGSSISSGFRTLPATAPQPATAYKATRPPPKRH